MPRAHGATACRIRANPFRSRHCMCMAEFSRGCASQHATLTRAFLGGPLVRIACCSVRLRCMLHAFCELEFVAAVLSLGCPSSSVWAWGGDLASRAFGVPTLAFLLGWRAPSPFGFTGFFWPTASQGRACESKRGLGLCGSALHAFHSGNFVLPGILVKAKVAWRVATRFRL